MAFNDRRRNRRNRAAFDRARETAGEDGMVCGFNDEDGTPRYFVVARGAPDDEIRERIFEVRNGRPMTKAEKMLDAGLSGDLLRAYEEALAHYLVREPDPILTALKAADVPG